MAVNDGVSYPQSIKGSNAENQKSDWARNDLDRSQGLGRAGTASPEHGWSCERSSSTVVNPYYTGNPRTMVGASKMGAIDRQEIIRRKKAASRSSSPELERRKSPISMINHQVAASPNPVERHSHAVDGAQEDTLRIGLEIERPRSALHRGDFRERGQNEFQYNHFKHSYGTLESSPLLATSPVAPWRSDFPLSQLRWASARADHEQAILRNARSAPSPQRTRAASNASLASSFIYKPPTSPLVQSSRPDTPDHSSRRKSRSPDKSRRHTFSPPSIRRLSGQALEHSHGQSRDQLLPLRSEKSYPYRAHQPRQSLDLGPYASLPHAPSSAMRRPSFSESPLHHAPLVGSYEESILRGRMSTTPSKPLNFVAQIGVLGKGNCKPSLRCPPHVSIPFPAVFYSYGSSNKTGSSNDQPSPYVGLIDIENSLPSIEGSDRRLNQKLREVLSAANSRGSSRTREEGSASESQAQRRRRQKQKRRSGSPRAPSGGCYRIPQQGQLQLVIKNPNKTAVKLFLVPYDLSDMDAGQKTFIRQRSYSAGPIIDMPLSSRKNLGTDRPEAGINNSGDVRDKPTLRYLIHLHICCPSKGRYYLYKAMRVVFANRVLDGKEKLRNEIQLPDPKYSTYKPGRDSGSNVSTPANKTVAARRSGTTSAYSPIEESPWSKLSRTLAQSLPSTDLGRHYDLPMPPLPPLPKLHLRPMSQHMSDGAMEIDWIDSDETRSLQSTLSSPIAIGRSETRHPANSLEIIENPFDFKHDWVQERRVQITPGLSGGRSESLLSRSLLDLLVSQEGGPELDQDL